MTAYSLVWLKMYWTRLLASYWGTLIKIVAVTKKKKTRDARFDMRNRQRPVMGSWQRRIHFCSRFPKLVITFFLHAQKPLLNLNAARSHWPNRNRDFQVPVVVTRLWSFSYRWPKRAGSGDEFGEHVEWTTHALASPGILLAVVKILLTENLQSIDVWNK